MITCRLSGSQDTKSVPAATQAQANRSGTFFAQKLSAKGDNIQSRKILPPRIANQTRDCARLRGAPAPSPLWKPRVRSKPARELQKAFDLCSSQNDVDLLDTREEDQELGKEGAKRTKRSLPRQDGAEIGTSGQRVRKTQASEYKFKEVVRKKAERSALPGHGCSDCQKFYEALRSWGTNATLVPLPECGHATRPSAQNVVCSPKQLQQEFSRHRYKHAPPETPEGFWELGFCDTLDSPVG
uniref:Splicing factor 4 n=1 Tax=Tetraselmis sp. GSL018 TaxID=582737 RepID=A0A061R785_9CHLO|mmetsp:Transcript_21592/g.51557  ORF Transcript_21592/g.51557 Transcript_21592/m.51557 type:complete len:241 (-) Transcript_21592:430-1152(-)